MKSIMTKMVSTINGNNTLRQRLTNGFLITAYCQQLEDMISEKIEAFHDLREKARNFRTCLRDEEAKSRLLMHRN